MYCSPTNNVEKKYQMKLTINKEKSIITE